MIAERFTFDGLNCFSAAQPVWLSHGVYGDFTDCRGKVFLHALPKRHFTVFDSGALPTFEHPQSCTDPLGAFLAAIASHAWRRPLRRAAGLRCADSCHAHHAGQSVRFRARSPSGPLPPPPQAAASMPLSPTQIRDLSRLLDVALALPVAKREAWLQQLPAPAQALLPHLLRALAAQGDGNQRLATLPRLPDTPVDAFSGQIVGPYRLKHEIGRGGMGSVWLAERADGIFEREVALKLPRLAKSASLAQRMARERQIGARLEHPHIARLYDAGIDDKGRPYLVMERVQGLNLRDHADARQLGVPERLRLMLQVCEAVAHAHRQLVVHRDIKPSNILVDASGSAKLLDFGVARLLDDDPGAPSATLSDSHRPDSHPHTPQYAAPEQVLGGAVSTATDVYSLGVVLYELLTGRRPFETGTQPSAGQTLTLLEAAPPAPSQARIDEAQASLRLASSVQALRRQLSGDLDAVLLHALQRHPADRYGNVERFADDLRCVLAQRLPSVLQPTPWRQAQRYARRHWRGLAVVATLLMLVAGAATLLLLEQGRTLAQEERLQQARLFLLSLIEDAEPVAGQTGAAVTGAQMVESALQRARTGLPDQPALRGEVLAEIALMQRRFGQPQRALALFQEAHALLQAHAPLDDPGRQIAAAQLALQWVEAGPDSDLARVRPLAAEALAGCKAGTTRCAKARAYAQMALRNLASRQGDDKAALPPARQVVVETDRAFGSTHAEAAMARVHLAIILRNDDQLTEAAALLAQARRVAAAAPLRAADARELRLIHTMVQADLGQHGTALAAAQALLDSAPAGDSDKPLLLRLQAQSALALGQLPQALAAAQQALVAAQAAQDGWSVALALQARTRTLAVMGQAARAQESLAALRSAVAALSLPSDSVQPLRVQRIAAELALRAGLQARADTELQALSAGELVARPASALDLALVWDLRGALSRQQQQHDTALAHHARAAALLAPMLPAGHPLRLRNALDSALARVLRSGGPADAALHEAAARYLNVLPADSAWRPMVQALLAKPAAGLQMVF